MRLPDVRRLHHRARRLARRAGAIAYRTIVVVLFEREETEHALDLACRLAADRRARVVLVAPLVVERELPLDARFDEELRTIRDRLDSAAAVAASYGVGVRREIVRTRPGLLGEKVARVALERGAELVVVGAPVESRRGFRRAFPHEVLLVLRAAPCRVMIATGPLAGARTSGRSGEFSALRPSENQAVRGRTEAAYP
jgi:nucleotide-binding universal stress UspA family protein